MAQPARAYSRSLTSILLEANVVRPEQVDAGLIRQRSSGLRIGETLVEMGAATESDIGSSRSFPASTCCQAGPTLEIMN